MRYSTKNDIIRQALQSLICSVLRWDKNEIVSVEVTNPILHCIQINFNYIRCAFPRWRRHRKKTSVIIRINGHNISRQGHGRT